MSQSPSATAGSTPESRSSGVEASNTSPVDPDELLSVLGDDHAQDILRAISEAPLPAREIADRLGISRATAYRRLNRLEDAGLVRAAMTYDSAGHHRKQFRPAVSGVQLTLEDGEFALDPIASTPDDRPDNTETAV